MHVQLSRDATRLVFGLDLKWPPVVRSNEQFKLGIPLRNNIVSNVCT